MFINCEVKNCVVKMRRGLREIQEGGERTRTRRGSSQHSPIILYKIILLTQLMS